MKYDSTASQKPLGTSINDVRRFSAIFDLYSTYHVRRFLPYNVRYLGAFLDPLPTLVLDVIYGRSLFPFM